MAESRSEVSGARFRVLRPKPAPHVFRPRPRPRSSRALQHRAGLTQDSLTGCCVPSCFATNCSSVQHRSLSRLIASRTIVGNDSFEQILTRVAPDIGLLAAMAAPSEMVDEVEWKELFHQYLTYDMPRIVALLYPPSSTQSPARFFMARTKAIAELGSTGPVYFLLFVSMAHILQLVRREQLEAERISARLYGCLMKVLRERLAVYKPSEVPHLILAVLAMSSFDMSLGYRDAVCHHHIALGQLVSQVGLSYLGHQASLVMSYDRLMSAFTSKPPLYAKMPDRSLLRDKAMPKKYGSALEQLDHGLELDPDVQTVCSDLCRANEIVETQNWTFRPERQYSPYSPSDIQYLYFLREVIQSSCISLHARDLQNPQVSRAVLFAVMIIQYVILGKNELTWYSTTAADRLYQLLSTSNLRSVWAGQESLLCWVMCVMILVAKPWKLRNEALNLVASWIETTRLVRRNDITRHTIGSICDFKKYIWCQPDLDNMLAVALEDIRTSPAGHDADRPSTSNRHEAISTRDQR